jgi:fructokinase
MISALMRGGEIAGMRDMIAGIEMGGTKTVVAVCDADDGEIRAMHRIATTDGPETMAGAVEWLAGQGGIEAVGVAAFGPVVVDPDRADYGTMLATPKPGWAGFPVLGTLRDAFPGARMALDTDVNAAALAEAGDLRDVVYITIGTGIGGGVLSGGRLVHGAGHPEFGHFKVPRMPGDDFKGVCPFHGDCLEGMACGPAMERRWGRPASELPPGHPAWECEAHYLAHGVLALLAIVSPERVFIGGGVSQAAGFHAMVETKLRSLAAGYFPLPDDGAFVVPPVHGQEAGIRGALALVG